MARAKRHALATVVATICASMASAGGATLSISECTENRTCNAEEKCVNGKTRLVLAQMRNTDGGVAYLSMGPMVENAGGGTFFEQDWRWIVGGLPSPSADRGRSNILTTDGTGLMAAHVFRPGREVRGFKSSDWVRADYSCKQVLF